MRIAIINHAGDVAEAYHRIEDSGTETYYAQRYSLDAYAGLLDYADDVAVMVLKTERRHEEKLPTGITAIACGYGYPYDYNDLFRRLRAFGTSHVILGTIDLTLLRWLLKNNLPTLPIFSSSLTDKAGNKLSRLKRHARNAAISFCLNRHQFEWVGSYGIKSALELARAGVRPEKIIPWDFLIEPSPGPFEPKQKPSGTPPRLIYVGAIHESKGVGDLLHAVAQLKERGVGVTANIIGNDRDKFAERLSRALGIEDQVELPGLVANDQLERVMNEHDAVVVPSRHDYPEGFPLVIHHALRSCTPIIASDHPMFVDTLRHQRTAMVFPAGDATGLARVTRELFENASLYEQLSRAAHPAWNRLRLDVKWADLTRRWASQDAAERSWLRDRSLVSATSAPLPRASGLGALAQRL